MQEFVSAKLAKDRKARKTNTQMKPGDKRILLVLPEAFGCEGGIQMFCRSLCLAAGRWAESHHASVSAIVLNDRNAPDSRYVNGGFSSYVAAGKSKARVVSAYLQQNVRHRNDLVIFGHVSLAPLMLIPTTRNPKTCIITYGIEVWQSPGRAEEQALRKADSVLAISEYTRSEVLKRNRLSPDKVRLFPCSLDPYWNAEDSNPQALSGAPVILTVCRLTKDDAYKGVDSVIKSLSAVVRECGPVAYRIVGEGDDVPRLISLAEELGVSSYITFVGALTEAALRSEYQRCSVFVMPSEGEGFGIVFLEAMAHGKPVIGGAHGGTTSVIEHEESGLLVNRRDVDSLAHSITRILKDDELRLRLGRAGNERVRHGFTFRSFQANFDSYLRTVFPAD
jgi:phosphatidyl-myo-inositol dimannoside synthase